MSVHITKHQYPASTEKAPLNARATAMAAALEPLYAELLAGCTNADEVSDLLHREKNPRLAIESTGDHTVKVSLKAQPRNMHLLTITAR